MTILAYSTQDVGAKAAVWTQLIDLLAQDQGKLSPEQSERAYDRLHELVGEVPERRKLASAASVASHLGNPKIVALFANDSPAVAAPVLMRCSLSGAQWASIIPEFPPASRSLLRERKGLPQEALSALGAFGLSDFALPNSHLPEAGIIHADLGRTDNAPATESKVAGDGVGPVPIDELVRRIDAYRERAKTTPQAPTQQHKASHFAFESDSTGLLSWIEGAPRAPLVGISLSEMAEGQSSGVDGQASGAFRKRAPIRDARLTVLGSSEAGGEWRVSAQPFFDPETGRFEGYRGVAKRQTSHLTRRGSPFAEGMSPGSLRQLVHELRTPLNAIRGFAEMIDGQFLGPVDAENRKRADTIIFESGRLLRVFEDLDVSAQLAASELPGFGQGEANITHLLRAAAIEQAPLADRRGVRLKVALPDGDARAVIDSVNATRMLDRLLLTLVATAERNELLTVSLSQDTAEVRIAAARPQMLRNVLDQILLDPSVDHGNAVADGDLPLGLAFILRLIRKLARQANGRFEIGEESFVLILRRAGVSNAESKESN